MMTDDVGEGLPPMTVVNYTEFQANPHIMYGLFSRSNSNTVLYDPEKAMLIKDRVLQVESVEELQQIRRELLSRPVLLNPHINHRHTSHNGFFKVKQDWTADFAILLNTAHAAIRTQLKEPFDLAASLCAQGEKFCIEIDVGPSIERWYSTLTEADVYPMVFCTEANSNKACDIRLYITNDTKYQHCFDCNAIWCVCFAPCWLLSALPYMCVRGATCRDIVPSFHRLPVVTRTPLSSGGYADLWPDAESQRQYGYSHVQRPYLPHVSSNSPLNAETTSQPTVTQPPAIQPPVIQPPVIQPPVIQPPDTQPPVY